MEKASKGALIHALEQTFSYFSVCLGQLEREDWDWEGGRSCQATLGIISGLAMAAGPVAQEVGRLYFKTGAVHLTRRAPGEPSLSTLPC